VMVPVLLMKLLESLKMPSPPEFDIVIVPELLMVPSLLEMPMSAEF